MFNLIVSGAEWEEGRFDFPLGRMLEYTARDIERQFRQDGAINFDELRQLPTLFMNEGVDDEVARVGTITAARAVQGNVRIECAFDHAIPAIPNSTLKALQRELDMDDWEFGRNHWAVKGSNLHRALLMDGLRRRVGPRVFQINERENIEADLVSVMMPFEAGFNNVYAALQGMCGELGRRCVRADDIWENDVVMQDVVSLIDRSRVVIADCTGRNANVFYEIGIAHTLGRDVVMITQNAGDVPFDLRHLRFVPYHDNGEGRTRLTAALRARIVDLA